MRDPVEEIEITLKPSKYWLLLLLSGVFVAIVASFYTGHLLLRVLTLTLFPLYACYLLRRYYWKNLNSSVKGIRYRNGRWWIKGTHLRWTETTLCEPPLVTAFLTVLCFRQSTFRKTHVAVFSDSVKSDAYRKLRVLLHLKTFHSKKQNH